MNAHAHAATSFAHPAHNTAALGVDTGMVIADFGAGSGHYALQCAERLEGTGCVYAIDVQRDLLRRIRNEAQRRGLKNIEVIAADIERPSGTHLAERAVDLALISNVLFQLEHPKAALMEAWRIVKPSGKVAVIDWSDSFRGLGPTKKHVFSKDAALGLASETGFELLKEFHAGAHHYGLIFKPRPRPRI